VFPGRHTTKSLLRSNKHLALILEAVASNKFAAGKGAKEEVSSRSADFIATTISEDKLSKPSKSLNDILRSYLTRQSKICAVEPVSGEFMPSNTSPSTVSQATPEQKQIFNAFYDDSANAHLNNMYFEEFATERGVYDMITAKIDAVLRAKYSESRERVASREQKTVESRRKEASKWNDSSEDPKDWSLVKLASYSRSCNNSLIDFLKTKITTLPIGNEATTVIYGDINRTDFDRLLFNNAAAETAATTLFNMRMLMPKLRSTATPAQQMLIEKVAVEKSVVAFYRHSASCGPCAIRRRTRLSAFGIKSALERAQTLGFVLPINETRAQSLAYEANALDSLPHPKVLFELQKKIKV